MKMQPVFMTPTMHPAGKGSHHTYILGEIPHGPSPTSQDVEQWGPPGFWHWISYQLLYPGQPTARGSPLSAITELTLLNLWFSFIHPQSQWDQTSPLPHGIKINNTMTTFLVPDQHDPSLFTLTLPFPSHLSWSQVTSALLVFDFWGFK